MKTRMKQFKEDWAKMRGMSDKEAWEYTKGCMRGDIAGIWVRMAWVINWLVVSNNVWQYFLARFILS